jgi:DNA-binding transcriptional LysR family regulator
LASCIGDLVVDVKRLEWDDQEVNLLSGDVDIAYIRESITERGLRLVPLYHERRLVALRRDHPLAEVEELWRARGSRRPCCRSRFAGVRGPVGAYVRRDGDAN